jgi:hypothetical protein
MSRWILGGSLAALLVFVIVYPRTASKTSYVNGLPPYTDLPGREYIFEQDCYIFKFKDAASDWPLVGSKFTVPDLPERVDAKFVGASLPNVTILDTVATGMRFRIVSVRRDQKGKQATISYEILFLDEAAHKYPRLDSTWMQDHTVEAPGAVPKILTDYAVPLRTT